MIGDVTLGMTANRMALHINMAYQKAGLTKSSFIKANRCLYVYKVELLFILHLICNGKLNELKGME